MSKTSAWVAGVLLGAAAGLWWWQGMPGFGHAGSAPQAGAVPERGARAAEAGRPIAVEVAEVRATRTSTDIRAIGSLQSDETVQLAPEIAGRVSEIDFVEGSKVKAGDILVRLDDALVRAEVADTEARLNLAEANNERARQLSRTGNVTERSGTRRSRTSKRRRPHWNSPRRGSTNIF